MIDCLTGNVINVEVDSITMEVGGIGFLVYCANPFRFQNYKSEKITVYTYQHVSQDAIRLYGFIDQEEKKLFQQLIRVSGIGPKGALAIIASGEPRMVVRAIEEEDEQLLIKFPGVGKKTARQIILDLKGKLDDFYPEDLFSQAAAANDGTMGDMKNKGMKDLNDAVEALRALGYTEREVNKVLPKLKGEDMSTDQYIKKALQLILQG